MHTYYRAKGSDSETEISESAGVYLLTFERTGDYIVRQTVTRNGRTAEKEYAVYVRTAESIFDAETDESGNHHGVGAKIADYASCFEDSISEEWSANGRYSMMIKPTNNAWAGYDYSADPKTLAYATNKFEIWVKTDVAVAGWALGIDDGTGWKSATLDLEAGAHKYVFTLSASVTQITRFYMRANGAAGTAEYTGVFYIDGLTALYEVPFNRAEGAVGDFEAYEGGEHFGIGSDGFVLDCPVGNISVSNEWASDGDYSVKVIPTGDGWSHIWSNTAITVSEYNTIEFDIYVDRAVSGYLFYVYDSNGYHEGKVDLKKGVNHVKYTFNQSFSTYRGIELRAAQALTGVYYIDRIVLSKV